MEYIDLAGNKLSILYFIGILNISLTNSQITDFFLQKYLINYFDLQQLLIDLIESGHLCYMESRNNHYYSLTAKGKEALELFMNKIDPGTKEKINTYAEENRTRLKKESQLTADYQRIDDNYYEVILKVMEVDETILDLRISVVNSTQAKTVCSNWRSKAPQIYKQIMESLIE